MALALSSTCVINARTKTFAAVVRDLLYADDCALMAHTQADDQLLFSQFLSAATRFDLGQSAWGRQKSCYNQSTVSHPRLSVIIAGETLFQQWKSSAVLAACCHRIRTLTTTWASRLAKATHSFGRLSRHLWDDNGIRLDTKVAVYKAVILTALQSSWLHSFMGQKHGLYIVVMCGN